VSTLLAIKEEARYLAVASHLLASIATVLVDTGMRPDECYRLRWEAVTWINGRNGTLLVTHGKTAAARRVLPMTPRVRAVMQARWDEKGRPSEGWIWPALARIAGHSSVTISGSRGTLRWAQNWAQSRNANRHTVPCRSRKPSTSLRDNWSALVSRPGNTLT
jgi:integrase